MFCCFSMLLRGQPEATNPFTSLNLYRLANQEGLSQVYVNVLFKDSEGFLWIGTDDGLNRFDGKDVVTYSYRYDDTTTIAANEVYGICEDKSGRLWFAHYNSGISVLDKRSNRFLRLSDGPGKLSTNRVYGLICDRDGFIVARTVEGISRIDPATLRVQNLDDASFQDVTNTAHLDVLEQGNHFWFGSKTKGLLRIDKQGKKVPVAGWNTALMGKSVFGLCAVSEKELLAVSEKGLFRICEAADDFRVEAVLADPVLFSSASKVIRYANTDYAWIATDDQGFFIIDVAQKKVVRHLRSELVKDNLLSNSVLCLLQDEERNVFIGTARGVNVYSPYNNLFNNYENTFRKIPKFGHPVYAIHELTNGNLLLGTRKGGAYHFDVNTFALDPIPVEGYSNRGRRVVIYHFTPLNAQDFLVCTGAGIFELRMQQPYKLARSRRFKELDSLSAFKITDLYFQNDSVAWIASFTEGLFRWNPKKHSLRQYRKSSQSPERGPVDDQIQKLVPTREGNLVLCTKYGFSIFNPASGFFQNVMPGKNYPYELPARNIKYAYDDGAAIWITTYGAGVHRFDKKKGFFTGYTTREGLPNDAVYSVIPDDSSRLWIGTNNGLALLNPGTGAIKTYTTQDGLPDNEFNGHAAYRSASGKIFYSTLNGIVSVNPSSEIKNNYKPDLVLTYLAADNGKKDSMYNTYKQGSFTLPAGYNSVTLRFAALSFASPRKNRYKVMLQGYDNSWLDMGNQNEMHYSSMPPGRYVFKVQAANNTGTWNEKELHVKINVLPFWYQASLFKALLVLAFAALALYLIRLYYRDRLHKQRQEYEKILAVQQERQRISAEIHDDIGAGLSGIRLLTEMTNQKIADPEMQVEVSKIYTSVSELSNKMREVIWSLDTDNDTLENLLYYMQRQAYILFENSGTNVQFSLPDVIPDVELDGEVRRHLYLTVKEALHNSLKHAAAATCCVAVQIEAQRLRIQVRDDGRGLVRENAFGSGMKSMQKRMAAVKGTFCVRNGVGTTVELEIPLKYRS